MENQELRFNMSNITIGEEEESYSSEEEEDWPRPFIPPMIADAMRIAEHNNNTSILRRAKNLDNDVSTQEPTDRRRRKSAQSFSPLAGLSKNMRRSAKREQQRRKKQENIGNSSTKVRSSRPSNRKQRSGHHNIVDPKEVLAEKKKREEIITVTEPPLNPDNAVITNID